MKCFSRLAGAVIVLWPLDELWIRLSAFHELKAVDGQVWQHLVRQSVYSALCSS
jgi:hypothetical protein